MVFCLLFTFLTQSSLFWQHNILGKITLAHRGWDQLSWVSPCTSWFHIFFQPGKVMWAVREKVAALKLLKLLRHFSLFFMMCNGKQQRNLGRNRRESRQGPQGTVMQQERSPRPGPGVWDKTMAKAKTRTSLVWKPNVSALLFRAESSWGRCDVSFLEPGQERKLFNS